MKHRLLLLVMVLRSTMTFGTLIEGPLPMNVVAPVGDTVTFTCVVNRTEIAAFLSFNWFVDGAILEISSNVKQVSVANGSLRIGTLELVQVASQYITKARTVQCEVTPMGSAPRSNNATLTVYGPPGAPSNLTSTQSSTGSALILSWSAPSSPVQLHYTVTVNTSTTTITVTNDTNITITSEDIMAAINSTQCDLYTFSVTATNPAGSSIPANLTTSFVPDPEDAQYNLCMSSSDNSTMITFQALEGYQYSIANESDCSNTTSSITNGLTVFQIPYPHNCTVLTVLAEHNCTERLIPVNISNVKTQCPVQPSPSTSANIFITTAVSTSSSPIITTVATPRPNIQIIVPVAVVLLLVAAAAVVTIIVLLVIVRQRKRKDSMVKPSGSVSTEDTDFKDKETKASYKEEKSIPPQQNKQPLPEYMTPADAVKLYKQNGNTNSTLKTPQQAPCVVQQPAAVPEYATPSVQHHTQQQVQDMPLYSDVFETQKANSLRSSQRKNNTFTDKPPASSLPPPPTATDEYSSLQHNLGGGGGPQQHQVVDQNQHVYDSAQGDQPQYSTIAQQKKTKYADVQFSPDSGLQIQGNTSSTVQYSVVGDTTNMEYSVVGPKTASSQNCPPPPPPPSAEVVRDMMNS